MQGNSVLCYSVGFTCPADLISSLRYCSNSGPFFSIISCYFRFVLLVPAVRTGAFDMANPACDSKPRHGASHCIPHTSMSTTFMLHTVHIRPRRPRVFSPGSGGVRQAPTTVLPRAVGRQIQPASCIMSSRCIHCKSQRTKTDKRQYTYTSRRPPSHLKKAHLGTNGVA